MFKLTKSEKGVVLDDVKAADLLEHNTYLQQRSINPARIKMYVRDMITGFFLTGHVVLVTLLYDSNRKVMVNGQHQCKAVIMSGKKITILYEEYECQTPQDLANLFSRFDANWGRTLPQILAPEADALGVKWKGRILNLVISAACIGKDGIRIGGSLGRLDRKDLLRKNIETGNFLDSILADGPSCRHMKRASVARAMMDTYSMDQKAARVFWIQVRDGRLLSRNHPCLKLRDYLLRTPQGSSALTREMYVKCIHAWNAYVSSETTSLKYFPELSIPKIKKPPKNEWNISLRKLVSFGDYCK